MALAPLTRDDRLPDTLAVWRTSPPALASVTGREVSADYGDGLIEQAKGEAVEWARVRRWRWGWAG